MTAEGIYPRIAINLPRDETEAFAGFVKQATDALAKQRADIEAFNAQIAATAAAAAPPGSASSMLDAPQLLAELRKQQAQLAERTLTLSLIPNP